MLFSCPVHRTVWTHGWEASPAAPVSGTRARPVPVAAREGIAVCCSWEAKKGSPNTWSTVKHLTVKLHENINKSDITYLFNWSQKFLFFVFWSERCIYHRCDIMCYVRGVYIATRNPALPDLQELSLPKCALGHWRNIYKCLWLTQLFMSLRQ